MTGIIKTDKLQSSAGNDALTIASNGGVTAAGAISATSYGAVSGTTGTFSGNVGIGTTSPAHNVEIVSTASGSVNDTLQIRNNATASGTGSRIRFINSTDANSDTNGASIASIRTGNDNDLTFETENAERMRITSDGRGLSQFTAKAWVNFNGTGTVAIRDSHNVSSITDNGVGQYRTNFANTMTNANYSFTAISYQNIRWATQNTSFAEVINAPYYGATHTDASNVNVNVFGD